MAYQIRVVKSEQEHAAAVKRLSEILDQDIEPGSPQEQELELLQLVLSTYERSRLQRPHVSALDALRFRMEQAQLTQKDLVPFIGSASKVSEVLSGERPLSLNMVKKLHHGLGIPAAALLAEESADRAGDEVEYDYEKFPLQEMYERGLFPNHAGGLSSLRANAQRLIKGFLATVQSVNATPALLRAPLFQSGGRTMDDYGLLVWRALVIRKAHRFPPRASYRPGVITAAWLRDLCKLSSFDKGPRLAHEYLSKHGICLVVENHFKKTYLDGAAMLDGNMPIVALTLRHDRLDNFWFALMHELVHVQLHLKSSRLFIADNLEDKARQSEKEETEADEGAQEALIPGKMWKASAVRRSYSLDDAFALAREAGVHPCIVAGRVRHETGNWRLLSTLISAGGSVKEHFCEQLQ
ncbi:MAG TPA: ImmA/IrrE family metallo-endopeptidase [Ramlibacter sp.]|jgi:HTH-type transcriptional regulator/antitoxin HigA|nr:ImmA/IrrE family metallo-endopeptidase [Ramlibacter sp.]